MITQHLGSQVYKSLSFWNRDALIHARFLTLMQSFAAAATENRLPLAEILNTGSVNGMQKIT